MRVFQNIHEPERGPSPSSAPWPALVGFVGLALLVAAVDGALTQPAMRTWYLSLNRPPGTPPGWLFAPVWTTLYVMIGIAAWMAWRQPGHGRALRLWGWQLLATALWTPLFFGLHLIGAALVESVVLLLLSGLAALAIGRLCRAAGWLMLPYLASICYATYLNAGFWWVNPA